MRTVKFGDFEIEIVDFDDVSAAERVLEFRYRDDPKKASFAAVVVPEGGDWSTALLTINPESGDVSVALIVQLIEVAREIIEAN